MLTNPQALEHTEKLVKTAAWGLQSESVFFFFYHIVNLCKLVNHMVATSSQIIWARLRNEE